MAPLIEQRGFAEEVAVAVERETQLFAVRVGGRNFDLAFDDDVELLARIAFLVEILAGAAAFFDQRSRDSAEERLVGGAQQGQAPQRVGVDRALCHRRE